jgi:hypothetical protein
MRRTLAALALPFGAVLSTVVGLTVAGCGDGGPAGDARVGASSVSPGSVRNASGAPTGASPRQEGRMRIRIVVGDQRFHATIADSAAGRDLVAQLPLTIDMTDHGAVEKTGPLPSPLSTAGQPDGADPEIGDVGYYAPGNDLVLYYGDQSYHPGIVIIGHLDGDAANRIADLQGTVTATVETQAG